LIQNGADVNAKDNAGKSTLQIAMDANRLPWATLQGLLPLSPEEMNEKQFQKLLDISNSEPWEAARIPFVTSAAEGMMVRLLSSGAKPGEIASCSIIRTTLQPPSCDSLSANAIKTYRYDSFMVEVEFRTYRRGWAGDAQVLPGSHVGPAANDATIFQGSLFGNCSRWR
jgi:hypothetical protein